MLSEKARKKPLKYFYILIGITGFIYLLIFTIPLGIGTKVEVGSYKNTSLSQGEKHKFTFKAERGTGYTISGYDLTSYGIDLVMYVCNGPYGAIGRKINDAGRGDSEYFTIKATRSGMISIILKNVRGSGECFVSVNEGSPTTGDAPLKVVPSNFTGMIFPFLIFIFLSALIYVKIIEGTQK